jgi:Flp pilus assembly protein TadD
MRCASLTPRRPTFLGAVYEKEGKKTEAKQAYEAALKLNPTLKSAAEGLKRVS